MTGGLMRPAAISVSRRKLLLALGAGAAAAPLSACDTGSPAALSILDKAESVTKAVQRALLAPRATLAPEYPQSARSQNISSPMAPIDPDDPDYVAAARPASTTGNSKSAASSNAHEAHARRLARNAVPDADHPA